MIQLRWGDETVWRNTHHKTIDEARASWANSKRRSNKPPPPDPEFREVPNQMPDEPEKSQMNPDNTSSTTDVDHSTTVIECEFMASFEMLALRQYAINQKHGFYDRPVDDGTRIALMHAELSEALEAMRHGDPPDSHIPEFSGMEAELADVILRIMDFSVYRNLNVARAIVAKLRYNATRPPMHGGKKF